MTQDFSKRFNIEIGLDEAKRRFINRAGNLIFTELLYDHRELSASKENFLREIATTLGEKYVYPSNAQVYIKGEFYRTLQAIEGFYGVASVFMRSEVERAVRRLLADSEINLSIRWTGGRFYLEGAPLLDEKLVNDVLGLLESRSLLTALEPFRKGLRHLLDSAQRPELCPDVITDMYESLEALARIITERPERDLSANRELFISRIKVSELYKELLKVYIDYACEFRHAAVESKPRPKISQREAESFVYLTGLFIRLALLPNSTP